MRTHLYYIKAGDEENNADWFVRALSTLDAIRLWEKASEFHPEDIDRIWQIAGTQSNTLDRSCLLWNDKSGAACVYENGEIK
jgi:hypothetical protein